ncbi:hypothetical protein [Finegoldia magna]|uniref:Uncharacterized protein n=1 Tax=Finegoldia magna (strain ATCC 29328 / DSM 20472 / WAL 2508) TaxID=334413 RepID=B0S4I7_FINM2|nr:hypothetical protein [Finegoldia magna]UEA71141.1 hypothetical protein LK415_09440 [Finegoldia magna]BAG09178.1 conserved hypothetical protein [Finegoldia magna ATCC 29328]
MYLNNELNKLKESLDKENKRANGKSTISFTIENNLKDEFKDICERNNSDMKNEIISFIKTTVEKEKQKMIDNNNKLKNIAEEITEKFKKLDKDSQQYIINRISICRPTEKGDNDFLEIIKDVFNANNIDISEKINSVEDKAMFVTFLKMFMYNASL